MSALPAPVPFWEKKGSPNHDAHRLLVISYHFPPDITIGARRWEKLAHAVTQRGWGLDVLTCEPSSTLGTALESLPGGVRVFGVPDPVLTTERIEHVVWRAYRTIIPNRRLAGATGTKATGSRGGIRERPESIDRAQIRSSVRTPRELLRTYWAWLELTHGERWAHRAAALAKRIFVRGVHEAVITSAPPHMSHEAGRLVSVETGIPFVMDMRDPWSLQPWLRESVASPLWYRHAERFERRCIEQASLVVANTEPARVALVQLHPDARAKIMTVMNGSDDDPLPPHRHSDRFTIGYAGTIYLDRDPQLLFRAAAQVIKAQALTPQQFGIDILGRFAAEQHVPLLGMAAQEGIADYVTVEPPRPQQAALEFLAGASMLVIFPGSNMLAIPAKVFEYIRFDSWLLTIAEPASGIAQLLRGSTADVVEPQIAAVAAVITDRYRDHIAGVRPTRVARDDRFSRNAQARLLLDAIAKLTSPETTPTPT
jgi:glycosyltransferase involved in cell wall biosynthesis